MLEEKTAMMSRTDGMLAGREASELLQAALQKLSPELRETVILRDLEELEYREIAQVLNVPEGTVKSQIEPGPGRTGPGAEAAEDTDMTCAELEILLCDYVDGTLHGAQKSALEDHLAGCAACAELARDVTGAIGVYGAGGRGGAARRAADADSARDPVDSRQPWWRRIFGRLVRIDSAAPLRDGNGDDDVVVLDGGAVCGDSTRQLRPADLDPVKIWMAVDDRAHRTWDRAMKYYENLRWVIEIAVAG